MAFGANRPRIRISIFFGILVVLVCGVCRSVWREQDVVISALLFLAGMLLVGVATLGRAWCSLYIAGYKTSSLVTQGPYSVSRHPLYFFSLAGLLGVGLCSHTLVIPALLVVGFAIYYPAAMRQEEAKLLGIHGQAYSAYAAAVPRFFPRMSKLTEPQQYVVNPKVFRKHLLESLLFVGIVGMLELMAALQQVGWLPVLLRIY